MNVLLAFFNLIETEAPQVKKNFIAVSLPNMTVKPLSGTLGDNVDIWLIITNAVFRHAFIQVIFL